MARKFTRHKQRLTPNQQQYKREIGRLKRAVKKLTSLGYSVPQEYLEISEKLPRIYKKDIARIAQRVEDLKHNSYGFSLVKEADTEAERLKNEIALRKRQLFEFREHLATMSMDSPSYRIQFELGQQMREDIDVLEKRLLEYSRPRNEFSEKNLVYSALTGRITELSEMNPFVEDYLKQALQEEIDTYGYDETMQSIADLDSDLVEKTERVLKYAQKDIYKSRQLAKLVEAIKGTMLTSAEMRNITELVEKGYYED